MNSFLTLHIYGAYHAVPRAFLSTIDIALTERSAKEAAALSTSVRNDYSPALELQAHCARIALQSNEEAAIKLEYIYDGLEMLKREAETY